MSKCIWCNERSIAFPGGSGCSKCPTIPYECSCGVEDSPHDRGCMRSPQYFRDIKAIIHIICLAERLHLNMYGCMRTPDWLNLYNGDAKCDYLIGYCICGAIHNKNENRYLSPISKRRAELYNKIF